LLSANPDEEFKFDGVDITPFIDSTGTFNSDSAFNHYLDSIETIFKIDTLHRNYKTKLPTKIYGGVNFKIDDRQYEVGPLTLLQLALVLLEAVYLLSVFEIWLSF
jgi:hypothetical protein